MKLTQTEKDRVDGILSGSENNVFLTKPIYDLFTFKTHKIFADAKFNKDELSIPVYCVSEGAKINVTVSSGNKFVVYDDWIIDRSGKNFTLYRVTYKSKKEKNVIGTQIAL